MSALFIFLSVVFFVVGLTVKKSHPGWFVVAAIMFLVTIENAGFAMRNSQKEAFSIIEAARTGRVTWSKVIERQATAPYKSRAGTIEKALASSDFSIALQRIMFALAAPEPIEPMERLLNTQISAVTALELQAALRAGYKATQQAYLDYVQQELSAALLVKTGLMAASLPDWDDASQGCDKRLWDCKGMKLYANPEPASQVTGSMP